MYTAARRLPDRVESASRINTRQQRQDRLQMLLLLLLHRIIVFRLQQLAIRHRGDGAGCYFCRFSISQAFKHDGLSRRKLAAAVIVLVL